MTASWFKAASVRPGGVLRLNMGALPNQAFGSAPADRPPSGGDLNKFACTG